MYKFINNAIDILFGFDIPGKLNEVLSFDTFSRDEIESYQKEKFYILKKYACQSEIYKDHLNKDLMDFPIFSREYKKYNLNKFIVPGVKPYTIRYTSGSSGKPMPIYVTKEMLLAKRVSHQKMLIWFDMNRESREFKIGGLPQSKKTLIYYRFRNKRYIHSFYISKKNMPAIAKRFNRFKPEIIYGYPSAISNLISYAELNDIMLFPPELIVTHAEKLSPSAIQKYKSYFPDVHVVNQYWATEANIGVTCPEGNLHIDEDTVICELINKDEKGVGDLLITNLYSYSFPYIRYPVRDKVKISDKLCKCGRKTKIIEYFEGRESDFLILPDGRIISYTAISFDRFYSDVASYQLFYKPKTGIMIFGYVPYNKNSYIDKKAISSKIANEYGLETEFMQLDQIQLSKGGKYKPLIVLDE